MDDDKEVIYVSSTSVPDRHVDLLLFESGGIHHCSTIRNFSRLASSRLSHHNGTVHCCRCCLHAYSSQELLDDHAIDCFHVQRTNFPEDPRCRFTNIQKQLLAPFVRTMRWILHRVLQPIVNLRLEPSKSTSNAALHTG